MNDSYLLISPADFFSVKKKFLYGDRYAFMESVLKYLERHDIPHMHCYDSIRIYPSDPFQVREICNQLSITDIQYFEHGRKVSYFEPKKRAKRGDKMVQLENGKNLTMRKFTVLANQKSKERMAIQASFPENKPFKGSFVNFKPKLWLFGAIESAVQGSFLW
jgi:hypothetical protein